MLISLLWKSRVCSAINLQLIVILKSCLNAFQGAILALILLTLIQKQNPFCFLLSHYSGIYFCVNQLEYFSGFFFYSQSLLSSGDKIPSPLVNTRILERNLSATSSQLQATGLNDMSFVPEAKQDSYFGIELCQNFHMSVTKSVVALDQSEWWSMCQQCCVRVGELKWFFLYTTSVVHFSKVHRWLLLVSSWNHEIASIQAPVHVIFHFVDGCNFSSKQSQFICFLLQIFFFFFNKKQLNF